MTSSDLKRMFGRRVADLRRRRGLTQEQLGEAIGKTVETVSNIERGFTSTRLETAAVIASAVGVSLPELFEIEEAEAAAHDRGRRRTVDEIVKIVSSLDDDALEAMRDIAVSAARMARGRSAKR